MGPPPVGIVVALVVAIAAGGLPLASAARAEAHPPQQHSQRGLTLLQAGANRRSQAGKRLVLSSAPALAVPPPADAKAPAPQVFNLMGRAMLPEDYVQQGLPPPSEQTSHLDPPWPMIGPALPSFPWVKKTPCGKSKGEEENDVAASKAGGKVVKAADVLAAAKANAASLSAAGGPSPAPAAAAMLAPAPAPVGAPAVAPLEPLVLGPFPGGDGSLYNPLAVQALATKEAKWKAEETFLSDAENIVTDASHMNTMLAGRLKDLSTEINRQSTDYWYALNNRTWFPSPPLGPHGALYPHKEPQGLWR